MAHRAFAIPSNIAPKISSFYNDSKPPKVAIVATGGGTQLCGWLIGTPGASSCILEMHIPYLQSSLTDYIGWSPKKYCCAETAECMAEKALIRSKELWLAQHDGQFQSLIGQQFVGLSSTSALISINKKKGKHKTFIACATDDGIIKHYDVILNKNLNRPRIHEDDIVSRLMLQTLFESTKNKTYLSIFNEINNNNNHTQNNNIDDNEIETNINHIKYHSILMKQNEFSQFSNNFFDKENEFSQNSGDEIIQRISKRPNALDSFLLETTESYSKQQNNFNKEEEEEKKKEEKVHVVSLNHSKTPICSKNVLFIPISMNDHDNIKDKEDKEIPNRDPKVKEEEEEEENFTKGMISFPDFKPRQRTLVYPGSFNPLHKGHEALAEYAQKMFSSEDKAVPFMYEIAVKNADKPAIAKDEIVKRITQFEKAKTPVMITKSALFSEKAKLLPNSVFLIGADTAKRILDKKYYHNNEQDMIVALTEIKQFNCLFLVAGRKSGNEFETLSSIFASLSTFPEPIKEMFIEIPADKFRVDISSTEIRNALKTKQDKKEKKEKMKA